MPHGSQPKSVFQIGGAGSVGTGSIRGMPLLRDCRDGGWAVWPFDGIGTHTVAEIYPRLFTGPVVKQHAASREAFLHRVLPELAPAMHSSMTASEDAFDAGCAAIGLSLLTPSATHAPAADPTVRLEGQILAPSAPIGH